MTSSNLSSRLKVTVRLFAAYAERVGTSHVDISLDDGATVAELLRELRRLVPAAAALPERPLCAVNLSHVLPGHVLQDGDEIALLPPLAGG